MLEEFSLCSFYKDLLSSHTYDPMCIIRRTDSEAEQELWPHRLENINNQNNTNGQHDRKLERNLPDSDTLGSLVV